MVQWLRICLPIQEMKETKVQSLVLEDPLEKGMATHSSILGWKIPWTKEPGRVESRGLQRVRHNLVTKQQQQQLSRSPTISEIYPELSVSRRLSVKNPPAKAGVTRDVGLIPGSGRSPAGGNGNPLQYSWLENPTDRGA